MKCIILGDKFQKRMKSKGCVGLIKINNSTNLVQHQCDVLTKYFPEADIIYVCGFEHKKLLNFLDKNPQLKNKLKIIYNQNYDIYNSAYSLYLTKEHLSDDCIILSGDHIIGNIFQKFSKLDHSQVFISRNNTKNLGCIINDSIIENIAHDLDNYLYDIYYISKNDIAQLYSHIDNKSNHNCFVFELINKLIINNHKIYPFFTNRISNEIK